MNARQGKDAQGQSLSQEAGEEVMTLSEEVESVVIELIALRARVVEVDALRDTWEKSCKVFEDRWNEALKLLSEVDLALGLRSRANWTKPAPELITALRARVSELEAKRDAQRDLILDTYEWFLKHVGHDGAPDGGDPPWVSDVFGLIGGEESHYPPDFEAILLSAVKRRANARAARVAELEGALEWATKQLGRAPELSTAFEWTQKHMVLKPSREGGQP